MSASDTCALYVGNISFKTTDESLAELFAGMGIVSAEVIKSRTGRSRGFGIVKFHTADEVGFGPGQPPLHRFGSLVSLGRRSDFES